MYFDNRIQHKPILAFLPFGSRSVLASLLAEELACMHRRLKGEQKSTRGNEPKGMQKSDKKSAYIPYLDNIELKCLIFCFGEVIDLVKIIELIFRLGGLETTQGACGFCLDKFSQRENNCA